VLLFVLLWLLLVLVVVVVVACALRLRVLDRTRGPPKEMTSPIHDEDPDKDVPRSRHSQD
jgi:hypothetical protein